MKFSLGSILAATAAGLQLVTAIDLDPNNIHSIKSAARTLAFGLQSYYVNNQTTTPADMVGTWPGPLWYWWKGGAIWGGMVDYWAYTADSTWNSVTQQGILAQVGPSKNFAPPTYNNVIGNDDQAFWALAAMSAAEYGFPMPQGQNGTAWIDLAKAVFDIQITRWDTATCGGGLRWQILESNNGWNYKNSISNGGLFQIAARLARYTGNQTYIDWSEKVWNWMDGIGLISPSYQVYDGSDALKNCTTLDQTQWTYNPAMMIYGTAALANLTNNQIWKTRTEGLLNSIEHNFFTMPNATDVMVETACEPANTCNNDQYSFKGYLSRWMAKSAVLYPAILPTVQKYLTATAHGVAKACTGGANGEACGQKWYTGGFDGKTGYDQQLTAMETVQALLLLNGAAPRRVPDTSNAVSSKVEPVTNRRGRRSVRGHWGLA